MNASTVTMLTAEVRHESTTSRDQKKLRQIVSLITGGGKTGIKRGELILKSGIPFAQWQFYHNVIIDIEDIEWLKSERVYKSMRVND